MNLRNLSKRELDALIQREIFDNMIFRFEDEFYYMSTVSTSQDRVENWVANDLIRVPYYTSNPLDMLNLLKVLGENYEIDVRSIKYGDGSCCYRFSLHSLELREYDPSEPFSPRTDTPVESALGPTFEEAMLTCIVHLLEKRLGIHALPCVEDELNR